MRNLFNAFIESFNWFTVPLYYLLSLCIYFAWLHVKVLCNRVWDDIFNKKTLWPGKQHGEKKELRYYLDIIHHDDFYIEGSVVGFVPIINLFAIIMWLTLDLCMICGTLLISILYFTISGIIKGVILWKEFYTFIRPKLKPLDWINAIQHKILSIKI